MRTSKRTFSPDNQQRFFYPFSDAELKRLSKRIGREKRSDSERSENRTVRQNAFAYTGINTSDLKFTNLTWYEALKRMNVEAMSRTDWMYLYMLVKCLETFPEFKGKVNLEIEAYGKYKPTVIRTLIDHIYSFYEKLKESCTFLYFTDTYEIYHVSTYDKSINDIVEIENPALVAYTDSGSGSSGWFTLDEIEGLDNENDKIVARILIRALIEKCHFCTWEHSRYLEMEIDNSIDQWTAYKHAFGDRSLDDLTDEEKETDEYYTLNSCFNKETLNRVVKWKQHINWIKLCNEPIDFDKVYDRIKENDMFSVWLRAGMFLIESGFIFDNYVYMFDEGISPIETYIIAPERIDNLYEVIDTFFVNEMTNGLGYTRVATVEGQFISDELTFQHWLVDLIFGFNFKNYSFYESTIPYRESDTIRTALSLSEFQWERLRRDIKVKKRTGYGVPTSKATRSESNQ